MTTTCSKTDAGPSSTFYRLQVQVQVQARHHRHNTTV